MTFSAYFFSVEPDSEYYIQVSTNSEWSVPLSIFMLDVPTRVNDSVIYAVVILVFVYILICFEVNTFGFTIMYIYKC